jgi:hypothetical protein
MAPPPLLRGLLGPGLFMFAILVGWVFSSVVAASRAPLHFSSPHAQPKVGAQSSGWIPRSTTQQPERICPAVVNMFTVCPPTPSRPFGTEFPSNCFRRAATLKTNTASVSTAPARSTSPATSSSRSALRNAPSRVPTFAPHCRSSPLHWLSSKSSPANSTASARSLQSTGRAS